MSPRRRWSRSCLCLSSNDCCVGFHGDPPLLLDVGTSEGRERGALAPGLQSRNGFLLDVLWMARPPWSSTGVRFGRFLRLLLSVTSSTGRRDCQMAMEFHGCRYAVRLRFCQRDAACSLSADDGLSTAECRGGQVDPNVDFKCRRFPRLSR